MLTTTNRKRIRDNSPCYRCEERAPGCHGDCERYQKWRQLLDWESDQEQSARQTAMIHKPHWVVKDIEKKVTRRKK
jgi:hypothetical protein